MAESELKTKPLADRLAHTVREHVDCDCLVCEAVDELRRLWVGIKALRHVATTRQNRVMSHRARITELEDENEHLKSQCPDE